MTSGYSSKYTVVNSSTTIVTIHEWTGMDSWCPLRGTFPVGVAKISVFPDRAEPVETATVIWTDEGSDEFKKYEFDLRGVVPRGVKGATVFELTNEGQWKVQFVPDL